jgi:hypothetical protein
MNGFSVEVMKLMDGVVLTEHVVTKELVPIILVVFTQEPSKGGKDKK